MSKKRTRTSNAWGSALQDHIINELDGATLSLALAHRTPIRSIHDARRRVKRARAGLRLLKPAKPKKLKREDRVLGDAMRLLGPIRDGHVTHLRHPDSVLPPPYSPKVASLVMATTVALTSSVARISRWGIDAVDRDSIETGLDASYRSAWERWGDARASGTDDELHRSRKAVKQLYYQLDMLTAVGFLAEGSGELKGRRARLDELGEVMGDYHDFTLLGHLNQNDQDNQVRQAAEMSELGDETLFLTPKKQRAWVRAHRS